MILIREAIPKKVRQSISDAFFKPIQLLMDLLDALLTPLQKLIGVNNMAYFFVLPNLLIFGIFILLPMLLNFYIGFTGGTSFAIENRPWVGTQNLEQILTCDDYTDANSCQEDYFWRGARNTFFFVVTQVTLMVGLALITAVALNGDIFGRGFFRSVFFFPVLLSPVVVALVWRWFLRVDSGLLNALLEDAGQERISFLTDSNWAQFWVVMITTWAEMGFYTLILLAGLQSIPASLYEAGQLDGANSFQRFTKITFPLLMPTMTVVLVLSLIRAVQVFDVVYVFTGGGPGTSTLYIVQYIFREAFGEGTQQLGMAASASLLLASVLLLLTLAQLFFARRGETE